MPMNTATAIAERTFVATATVTINGQELDDLDSLVEGQPVPLTVVLEQVGGSEAIRDVLAESFPDEQLVDFTRLNRVTITCNKPDGDDSAGCSDFDVTPAYQELQWPERDFGFEFTPRRDGEIKIKVRVEGLVIERPSNEIETAYVAVDTDFTVVVDVHPERVLWNTFQASLRGPAPGLMVDVPDAESVRVDETLEVSSTFTYPDGVVPEIPIGIELQLERDADGADASITPNESRQEAGSIHQSWLVTPNEPGALGLLFSYGASATVLDVDVSAATHAADREVVRCAPAPGRRRVAARTCLERVGDARGRRGNAARDRHDRWRALRQASPEACEARRRRSAGRVAAFERETPSTDLVGECDIITDVHRYRERSGAWQTATVRTGSSATRG